MARALWIGGADIDRGMGWPGASHICEDLYKDTRLALAVGTGNLKGARAWIKEVWNAGLC